MRSEADIELYRTVQSNQIRKDAEHQRIQEELQQKVDAQKQVTEHYRCRETAAMSMLALIIGDKNIGSKAQ